MDKNNSLQSIPPIKYRFIVALKDIFEKDNNLGGRPTKFTDETVGKLRSAFMMGCNDTEACYYAQINRDTLHEWRQKYKWFSDKIEAWKNHPIMKAKTTIFNHLNEVKVAQWYLERKCRDEFCLRREINVKSDPGTLLSVIDRLEMENRYEELGRRAKEELEKTSQANNK